MEWKMKRLIILLLAAFLITSCVTTKRDYKMPVIIDLTQAQNISNVPITVYIDIDIIAEVPKNIDVQASGELDLPLPLLP
jgi:PBP1b-binding outer membrane lipoprotein LpoB